MKTIALCLLVMLGSSCARKNQPPPEAGGRKLVCKREVAVGSHIARKVCRYEDEPRDRERTRQAYEDLKGRRTDSPGGTKRLGAQ